MNSVKEAAQEAFRPRRVAAMILMMTSAAISVELAAWTGLACWSAGVFTVTIWWQVEEEEK